MKGLQVILKTILFFIATYTTTNVAEASCFKVPPTLSPNQIEVVRAAGQLDMSWSFGERGESRFRFVTEENEVYLELFLVGKALSLITEEMRSLLKAGTTDVGKEYFYFTYVLENEDRGFHYVPLRSKMHDSPDSSSYLVHERRILSEEIIEVDENFLQNSLLSGRVAIYTGAGISAAAGVPTMGQLNNLLEFEEGEKFLKSLEKVVHNPKEVAKSVRLFHNDCFTSSDTAAHKAIAELSMEHGIPVITENLDCLHEVSGILPYRINANEIRQEVSQEEVHSIDWIVCMGLSYDDRGFLGWYKYMNPDGRILAIDTGKPSYLGSEDYILHADLQAILPKVALK